MTRGFSGELWIAGARGLGRLDGPVSQVLDGAPGRRPGRSQLPAARARTARCSRPQSTRARAHKVAVRFAGGRYQRVFDSTRMLRAWRGPHGSVWVLEGTRTWRLSGGQQEAVARHGPLAGLVYDIVTEPGGVFWIASTTGLGRYAPSLWRTPDAIKAFDQPVHSAVEDAPGRLWFAATEALLELDGDTWRVHPLPRGHADGPEPVGVARHPAGRAAGDDHEHSGQDAGRHGLRSTHRRVRRGCCTADGRGLLQLWRGRGDRILVRTTPPCAIEIRDGGGHQPVPALSAPGVCEKMRELSRRRRRQRVVRHDGPGRRRAAPRRHARSIASGPTTATPSSAVYSLLAPDRGARAGRRTRRPRRARWAAAGPCASGRSTPSAA